MARKPSVNDTQSAAYSTQNLGKLAKCAIVAISPTGTIGAINDVAKLLLNPESIEDDQSTNWINQTVPGQSLPMKQWVSGGVRSISFDALVSKDTSDFLTNQTTNPLGDLGQKAINAVGSIASNFLGADIDVSTLTGIFQPVKKGPGQDLSIEDNLNYYRSLLYPTYTRKRRLATSPPLIALFMGSTISGSFVAPEEGTSIDATTDVFVLVDLKIRITKALPDITPMEAIVSFKFEQYNIKSFGQEHF